MKITNVPELTAKPQALHVDDDFSDISGYTGCTTDDDDEDSYDSNEIQYLGSQNFSASVISEELTIVQQTKHQQCSENYQKQPNKKHEFNEKTIPAKSKDVPGRFPENHVNFSSLAMPIKWYSDTCSWFGIQTFPLKNDLLSEFDSTEAICNAAPLLWGTQEELNSVRHATELFSEGVDNNNNISKIGKFLIKSIHLNMMKNRAKVINHYTENMDFIQASGSFTKPLIVTGAPRSGTTLLQRLLSEDPNSRSPYTYEMETAFPVLKTGADPSKDDRIKSSTAAMGLLQTLAPGFIEKFAESHLWSATEKEESFIYMMAHHGVSIMNQSNSSKEYQQYLKHLNTKAIFSYEHRFFEMLDAYCPAKSHWAVKAPYYASYLDKLFEEYPDARVVINHRNPLVVIPSACRLFESWAIAFHTEKSFDKHEFGRTIRQHVSTMLLGPFQYRKEHPEKESQIFDCVYEDLVADPFVMLKKIYDKFDLTNSEEMHENAKAYLEANKQGKHGRHKYSLEEYGFTADDICTEYKEYMEFYGFSIPKKN